MITPNDNNWGPEDDEWVEKLERASKKKRKRDRPSKIAEGAVIGMGVGTALSPLIRGSARYIPKLRRYVPEAVMGTMAAGSIIGGIKGNQNYKKHKNDSNEYDRRKYRYKKIEDPKHREHIRKYDSDPEKLIDMDYIKRGGYKPYKKDKNFSDTLAKKLTSISEESQKKYPSQKGVGMETWYDPKLGSTEVHFGWDDIDYVNLTITDKGKIYDENGKKLISASDAKKLLRSEIDKMHSENIPGTRDKLSYLRSRI